MKKIAIISDSHGFLDQKIINHIKKCDELWHAGDIGNINTLDYLEKIINIKAVYGKLMVKKLEQDALKIYFLIVKELMF